MWDVLRKNERNCANCAISGPSKQDHGVNWVLKHECPLASGRGSEFCREVRGNKR